MRTLALLLVVIFAAVAVGTGHAATGPGKQLAALRRHVATLTARNAGLEHKVRSLNAQLQLARASAPSPVSQIERLTPQQIMRSIFPPVMDWLSAHYGGTGIWSQYRLGAYVSFEFTCFECG